MSFHSPQQSSRRFCKLSCLVEKKCYCSSHRTTPPIILWSPLSLVLTHLLSIILLRTSLLPEVSTLALCVCVCVYVCVCIVCGRVACARVAIPSDCQRGSWETYCMGQTTGFLYHFSRFLFFRSHSRK